MSTFTVEWDGGILKDYPHFADEATLAQGHVFKKYQLLGRITVGGKLVPTQITSVDGSEEIYAVCGADVDTTADGLNQDVKKPVFLSGAFVQEVVEAAGDGNHNLDSDAVKDALRALNIYIRKYGGAS